ncbi:MAG: c-type cytochrome [Gammaproteobacteria bacterium]
MQYRFIRTQFNLLVQGTFRQFGRVFNAASTLGLVMIALASASFAQALDINVDNAADVDSHAKADPIRGGEISSTCTQCHGPDGNSLAGAFPSIAGQGERYLYEQMKAIRNGERPAPLMVGQLDNMTDQDLKDMAAWYSGNEAQVGQADSSNLDLGRSLYTHGDPSRNIPACTACHGVRGQGIESAGFPALSGQYAQYTSKTLKDYQSGHRGSGVNGVMNDLADRLTPEEIAALANFIQGLY